MISLYIIKSVNTKLNLSLSQYGENKSNTDMFRIGTIPCSLITARSQSARRFDNCKEKSREILDWLINKGIITWCFSYWPSYRSSVCCIGVRLRLRSTQQASDLWLGQYEKHHLIISYYANNCWLKLCLYEFCWSDLWITDILID